MQLLLLSNNEERIVSIHLFFYSDGIFFILVRNSFPLRILYALAYIIKMLPPREHQAFFFFIVLDVQGMLAHSS